MIASKRSLMPFLSTFLNASPLTFSWMMPRDSVAPAMAVRMNPAVSGSR